MFQNGIIRTAVPSDALAIEQFLENHNVVHRHLDWRKPIDWLGSAFFLIQVSPDNSINAILNVAPEPENIYWVRLFAYDFWQTETMYWESLFGNGLEIIKSQSRNPIIASLSYQKWMTNLLEKEGWEEKQRVVQLNWDGQGKNILKSFKADSFIRKMNEKDLDAVNEIDDACFQPIWRQSRKAIGYSYAQSAYATVLEKDHTICGFQISTNENRKAHLARIAVLPEFQRQHIAEKLVLDMLSHFIITRAKTITVNTQQDNKGSIALYEKLEFKRTNESFPIFTYS